MSEENRSIIILEEKESLDSSTQEVSSESEECGDCGVTFAHICQKISINSTIKWFSETPRESSSLPHIFIVPAVVTTKVQISSKGKNATY